VLGGRSSHSLLPSIPIWRRTRRMLPNSCS
jgi:hypothetical protein